MTSGVKQALPQVLMPKTGSEGKASRNRAPQGDFAEALGIGKPSRQPKSAEAKTDRQAIDVKPLWQRLAAKLDAPADHSQMIAAKLAAASEKPEAGESDDDNIDKADKKSGDRDAMEPATPTIARHAADATQPLTPPSTSIPAEAAEQTSQQHDQAASGEDLPKPEARDVIVDSDGHKTSPAIISKAPEKQDSTAPIFVPMGRSEASGSIGFEPAGSPISALAEQSSTDRTQPKDALPEASAEPAKAMPRVTVLAQQSIPAPVPQTSVVLVESITASDILDPARSTPALDAIHASATQASATQSLKIQLHPAELGMVTATLRFAGEQLSIELQVENHEAYRQLSSDSDTIVNSLRDLGYDVDRVTVMQPQLASTPAGRSEAGATLPPPQGRAPEQFGSGVGPGGNGGSGGRQSSERGSSSHGGQQHPPTAREQQGSGLYI